MVYLSLLLSALFFLLGLLHFYWAVGGQWALAAALPTEPSGRRVLNPGAGACVVVGVGLSLFGAYYLARAGLLGYTPPEWAMAAAGWAIPLLFALRGIGDFTFVGFFKSVKNTPFARRDTVLYAPLCLAIAGAGAWLAWHL